MKKEVQQVNELFSGTIPNINWEAPTYYVGKHYAYSIQVTGALAGNGKIQVSLDGENWCDLSGSTAALAGTCHVWNIVSNACPFVRLFLDNMNGVSVEVLGCAK